jgi:DNA-binding MarR family transcriptional regulator
MAPKQQLTRQQLDAWRSFIEVSADLTRLVTADLQAEAGLSSGDYGVMLALSEAEGRTLRSSELAANMNWERSRLSHHIGRMERRGLVRRDECLVDTRGAEVSLTEKGGAAFRQATGPHFRSIKRLFADALSAEELEAVGRAAASLRRHLDAATTSGSVDR